MAADAKSPTPESPTTVRPLDMDDDDVQDASITLDDNTTTPVKPTATTAAASGGAATAVPAAASTPADTAKTPTTTTTTTDAALATDEAPPPKPPRPLTERERNEQTLREAFPTVHWTVIRAVLTASRNDMEASFNALLHMTDPSAAEQDEEPVPPPKPPRPAANTYAGAPTSQVLADEEYARMLAQQYESEAGQYEARTSGTSARSAYGAQHGSQSQRQRSRDSGLKPNEMWGDREHSFLDDDLPVIQESLRKGLAETQVKFNTWFTGIKKKINEELNAGDEYDDDDDGSAGGARRQRKHEQQARAQAQAQGQAQGSAQGSAQGPAQGRYGAYRQPPRRSGDYDADPELLSDDFAGIQLHGDGTPVRNPNVFRPPPATSPRPSSDRKVAFRDEPETIGAPKPPSKDGTAAGGGGSKASKWQPMSSVDPTPLADHDDPFSLGDSEDEKDTAKGDKGDKADKADKGDKGDKVDKADADKPSTDDAERLRKAAAEAMADSLVEDKPKA